MNGIIGRYELRVPRDYQEIEYLKCNGTQYIDTGLVGSDLSNCEIEAIIKNETTDTTAYNFNGAFLSGSTAQFGLVATSSTECRATINFGFVSAIGVTNLALSQYHTFYIKNGLQKVDGVTIDTLNLGTLNGQKFLLFARTNSSDSSITNCPAMSLKAFSVKSNGSYIRNMIPVRRISDGVLGLYDTANNVFYTNQGTNSFIAGSDVDNWKDIPYSQLETATDVVTSLPVKVYGDGETDISLLLKGNTETSGTPSPSNPVTVDGVGEETANSFNINGTWTKQNPSDTVTVSGNSVTITSAYFAYQVITVEPNTDYTLSYSSEGNYTLVRGYNSSTFSSSSQVFSANRSPITFNTGNTETLYVLFYSGTGTTGTTTYSDIMLSEGAAIPFEPYGKYKISILNGLAPLTPIYLNEPLLLFNNTVDTLDSNGTVTYAFKKKILDGTEPWTEYQTASHFFYITLSPSASVSSATLNTHYPTSQFQVVASNILRFYDNAYVYQTADDFKTFLAQQYAAGTPVTIWYIRTTPTTESVTVPTITTTGGEVTLDVDTTVKPSEISLTYHGWHEHQPLKRENGQWV